MPLIHSYHNLSSQFRTRNAKKNQTTNWALRPWVKYPSCQSLDSNQRKRLFSKSLVDSDQFNFIMRHAKLVATFYCPATSHEIQMTMGLKNLLALALIKYHSGTECPIQKQNFYLKPFSFHKYPQYLFERTHRIVKRVMEFIEFHFHYFATA